MKLKMLFAGYILTIVGLFFYSFTQIDLSLAISRNIALQKIVASFQYIGYFQRPLSTYLFVAIILLLFGFYIAYLLLAVQKKLQKKSVWTIILLSAILLTFSYNAFSYDIFNYIFDARIFTHYQQNPYLHKALDFPADHMLSFMRWTHRDYPYGPAWLGLTIPISYIGLQYFIPTFILFKIFISASYIGSVYYIGKIANKIAPKKELYAMIFFGLNPLVIIESLVSSHIDSVMMFFALFGFYQLISQKYIRSYIGFLVSIGIKFATGLILPVFILVNILQKKKKEIHWDNIWTICCVLLIGGVIAQTSRGNFQPWYLLDVLAFAAFIAQRYYVVLPSIIISFFALLNYVPFLYTGNWNKPIPEIIAHLNVTSYCISIIVVAIYFFYKKFNNTKNIHKNK